jgi:hypothetical protein
VSSAAALTNLTIRQSDNPSDPTTDVDVDWRLDWQCIFNLYMMQSELTDLSWSNHVEQRAGSQYPQLLIHRLHWIDCECTVATVGDGHCSNGHTFSGAVGANCRQELQLWMRIYLILEAERLMKLRVNQNQMAQLQQQHLIHDHQRQWHVDNDDDDDDDPELAEECALLLVCVQ